MGVSRPSEKTPIPDLKFFDESLNDSQRDAVRFCLESPEVACIHGPPGMSSNGIPYALYPSDLNSGTGKTHTLIEIIRQLTTPTPINSKPLRLLICGASNLSVDNILERLLALPPSKKDERLKVTRIGHPARVMAHEGVLESTLEMKATRTDQVRIFRIIEGLRKLPRAV